MPEPMPLWMQQMLGGYETSNQNENISTNNSYQTKIFKNPMEKKKYWDSLVGKYGEWVKGKTDFLDLLTKELPETYYITDNSFKYSFNENGLPDISNTNVLPNVNIKEWIKANEGIDKISMKIPKTTILNEIENNPNVEDKSIFAASILEEGLNKLLTNIGKYKEGDGMPYGPGDGRDIYIPVTKERPYLIKHLWNLGLDSIWDLPDLINKNYLQKDILKRVHPNSEFTFENWQDALFVVNAFMKRSSDTVDKVLSEKNIQVSPETKKILLLAGYQAGEPNIKKIIDSWSQQGLLENDNILKTKPKYWLNSYNSAMKKYIIAKMMKDEGFFKDKEKILMEFKDYIKQQNK